MFFRSLRYLLVIVIMHGTICSRAVVYAQTSPGRPDTIDLSNAINLHTFETAALDVYLKGPDGQPVQVAAVVTLIKLSKEAYRQETAKAGHIRFKNIAAMEYSVQVVAPGYQMAVKRVEAHKDDVGAVTIELQQLSAEDASEYSAYKALAPKAQKEIGKVLELLRTQKVADARSHLDKANRVAPNQAEVQYLYGVYARQTGNEEQAKAYWMKAVEFSPNHLLALLSLADALLRENHETEALPYAARAVEVEPSSWRAHTILANVYLRLGSADRGSPAGRARARVGARASRNCATSYGGSPGEKGREGARDLRSAKLLERAPRGYRGHQAAGRAAENLGRGRFGRGKRADRRRNVHFHQRGDLTAASFELDAPGRG